jgi:hypothetical protein
VLPYDRERVQRTRTFGPYVMPPEAQNDPYIELKNLGRQYGRDLTRDPFPRLSAEELTPA